MRANQRLIDLLAEVLDVPGADIGEDTRLEEIEGWDSVNALRALLHLETTYGVKLSLERFSDAVTVRGLGELVDGARPHG